MKVGTLAAILFSLAGLLFMAAAALPSLLRDRPFNTVFFVLGCAMLVLGGVFVIASRPVSRR